MRFNELVAGVRGDVAVKVYGDDFDSLGATADEIGRALSSVPGAADVKVEQTEGCLFSRSTSIEDAIARYGLNVAEVQDVVSVAMGGREAGLVFEGDRRFDLVVRMPDAIRSRMNELKNLPIPLAQNNDRERMQFADADDAMADTVGFLPLGSVATIQLADGTNQISRENGKRLVVVQANVRGRDLGSFVLEAQQKVAAVKVPPGSWLAWGGQYENLVAAKQRLSIVVPACFLMIFLLLFGSFKSAKYALLVFSAVPAGPDGWHPRAMAARHAVLDLGRGRLHRALWRCGPQWLGDGQLHQPTSVAKASRGTKRSFAAH